MKKYLVIYHSTKKIECTTILWWVNLVLLFVHLTSRLASTFSSTLYHAFTPSSKEIFDALSEAKVFNTLDLRFSYHQLPLKEGEKVKITFWELIPMGRIICTDGSFCHVVWRMPLQNFKRSRIECWRVLGLPNDTLMTSLFLA